MLVALKLSFANCILFLWGCRLDAWNALELSPLLMPPRPLHGEHPVFPVRAQAFSLVCPVPGGLQGEIVRLSSLRQREGWTPMVTSEAAAIGAAGPLTSNNPTT